METILHKLDKSDRRVPKIDAEEIVEVDAHTALKNHFERYSWDKTLHPDKVTVDEIYSLDI